MSKSKKKKPVKPRNEAHFEILDIMTKHVKPGRHKTGKKDKKTRREAREYKEMISEV